MVLNEGLLDFIIVLFTHHPGPIVVIGLCQVVTRPWKGVDVALGFGCTLRIVVNTAWNWRLLRAAEVGQT
jgi:hypothetical protein